MVKLASVAACLIAALGVAVGQAGADQSSAPPGSKAAKAAKNIAAGYRHTCAVMEEQRVRCWGNKGGNLGLGNTKRIGDDEHPKAAKRVKLGSSAKAIAAGGFVTCAVQAKGKLRCWGGGKDGELGYPGQTKIGDDEHPKSLPSVKLGSKIKQVTVGGHQSCAILTKAEVRCWGLNDVGQLGYGNRKTIGDDEHPAKAGPVKLGGKAVAITSGNRHNCAILKGGDVRCWGLNDVGQLGYAHTKAIGDNEHPAKAGPVKLGGRALAIEAEGHHTCALLDDQTLRCWGSNADYSCSYDCPGAGKLGYGHTEDVGDDETPAAAGPVPVGGPVSSITVGFTTSCAVLVGGDVRCWGGGYDGAVGYPGMEFVGDDETPVELDPIELGAPALALGSGFLHNCAVLEAGRLRCWGDNGAGQLGYAHKEAVGDNESPGSAGPVKLGGSVAH